MNFILHGAGFIELSVNDKTLPFFKVSDKEQHITIFTSGIYFWKHDPSVSLNVLYVSPHLRNPFKKILRKTALPE